MVLLTPAEAISSWADGWAWSRHAGRPRLVDHVWRIEVGSERESVRWLLPSPTPQRLADVLGQAHPANTAVKLVGDPAEWESRFPEGWVADIAVWLMCAELRRAAARPPAGYSLERSEEDHVVAVRVLAPDGSLAARGRVGLGELAVPDQIVTEPDHRRLGLGSVVMADLGNAALDAGRDRAVLGASADGRALYASLGWEVVGRRTGMYYRPRD